MRKIGYLFLIIMLVFLSGCNLFLPSISQTREYDSTFVNFEDIQYSVIENVLSDENSVVIENGYYMPEVGLLCFDITLIEHQEKFDYGVSYRFEDEENQRYSSSLHSGLSINEDGTSGTICHDDVEYHEYTVNISRSFANNKKSVVLAEITYTDNDFNGREEFHFEMVKHEQDTVPFLGNPQIVFDIKVTGNINVLQGELYLVLRNGHNEPFVKEKLSVDDFILVDDEWIINDFTFDGLVINHRYYVILLYSPNDEIDLEFRLQEGNLSADSSNMENLYTSCSFDFLCAKIYEHDIVGDTVTYNLYLYNGVAHLNENLTDTNEITAKVYNNSNELLYSVSVTSDSFDVPLDRIPDRGRIELESDILIVEEEFLGSSKIEYYYLLDTVEITNGEID